MPSRPAPEVPPGAAPAPRARRPGPLAVPAGLPVRPAARRRLLLAVAGPAALAALVVVAVVVAAAAGWRVGSGSSVSAPPPVPAATESGSPAGTGVAAAPLPSSPARKATRSAVERPTPQLPAQDVLAGLESTRIPQSGTGRLIVVPGSVKAPGRGRVHTVRVEVEQGLPVDRAAFAAFVLDTLNDPRGWGRGGTRTFARTSGEADMRVILASPVTSARLCRPLRTGGTLSCGLVGRAVLTHYRWVKGTPDYGTDRTGYRRYLVNHEVGHLLGHSHERCPGKGKPAPLMQQQTKGLKGCRKNSWPLP